MKTETVCVDWIRDHLFLMQDRSGFPIVMTQPSGVNAADLLPLSVIGCAVWDIISILQKQRQPITGLHVSATSDRDDDPPWRFRKIQIHYQFTGPDLNEQHIKRAIELSENKYCSTHATLREAVEIVSEYEITTDQVGRPGAVMAEKDIADRSSLDSPVQVVTRFNDALNAHDVDRMLQLMAEDCLFENTYPAPDGTRYQGQESMRRFWEDFFRTSRQPRIEIEEIFALGERCIMLSKYHWVDAQGGSGHVRGVDIYTVKGGLIAEKLSYVKG